MDRFINEDVYKKIRPDSFCSAIFSLDISKEGIQIWNGQSTNGTIAVSVGGRVFRQVDEQMRLINSPRSLGHGEPAWAVLTLAHCSLLHLFLLWGLERG